MTEPTVAQIAIAGMTALTIGSFATGVSVLLKVTELTTLMSHSQYGVIPRLTAAEQTLVRHGQRMDRAGIGDSDE
jgi:hypothetical protein